MSTNDPMTREQLDAIRERVDGATSGPWGCYGDGAHEVFDAGEYSDGDPGEVVAAVIEKLSDAQFIAQAREDIPALLAEVERLRTRAALADAMIERVARDTAAKESFISRRSWGDLSHDERTYRRAQAHRVLAADLGTGEEA